MKKNSTFFDKQIKNLQSNERKATIIFVDGDDQRVVTASEWLKRKKICNCILVTKRFIEKHPNLKKLSETLFLLRKHRGVTRTIAEKLILEPRYFGTLLASEGCGDAVIGGANMSTKDALLPFLQLFRKPKKFVSSIFLMCKNDKLALFSDCALNFVKSAADVADIAENVYLYHCDLFDFPPRVALLSFSTNNSGSGSNVANIQQAKKILINERGYSNKHFYGEIQFDAAVNPFIANQKKIQSEVAGNANCFVFPSLNAANIGYKMLTQWGDFLAIGPILTNVLFPCSDLSRGCTVDEIVLTAVLLSTQSLN